MTKGYCIFCMDRAFIYFFNCNYFEIFLYGPVMSVAYINISQWSSQSIWNLFPHCVFCCFFLLRINVLINAREIYTHWDFIWTLFHTYNKSLFSAKYKWEVYFWLSLYKLKNYFTSINLDTYSSQVCSALYRLPV